ncbi:hypothetical protein [Streptomyces virginiae]|uniref:hypothetical protein n=1 Tax=Streptomyces virginiae TaxID=1961 RepID=UPI0022538232|nr:hypothetical protein [Streptomyces virginiae]MCX4958012.1 hypothetical protein [Streptomyces virginiae]MCX5176840.1 hypothetical protein [Streptomyces virginiae]
MNETVDAARDVEGPVLGHAFGQSRLVRDTEAGERWLAGRETPPAPRPERGRVALPGSR